MSSLLLIAFGADGGQVTYALKSLEGLETLF